MKEEITYQQYIEFLKEHMSQISKFSRHLGYNQGSIRRILQGLSNPDPFVLYQASLAASNVLDQDSHIH